MQLLEFTRGMDGVFQQFTVLYQELDGVVQVRRVASRESSALTQRDGWVYV